MSTLGETRMIRLLLLKEDVYVKTDKIVHLVKADLRRLPSHHPCWHTHLLYCISLFQGRTYHESRYIQQGMYDAVMSAGFKSPPDISEFVKHSHLHDSIGIVIKENL